MRARAGGLALVVVDLGFPGTTSGRVVCLQGKVLKQPKESVEAAE